MTMSKSLITIIIEALLFLAIIFTINKCDSDKINVLENNIIGYKNKIEQAELKNGELLSSKQSLIMDKDALKEELDISKAELKELEKKLNSKIAQINRLNTQINVKDTVYLTSDTIKNQDDILIKSFKWNDQYSSLSAKIKGKTIIDSELAIYDFNIIVPIEFGITNDYKVWAKSTNPNVTINDITSMTVYGSTLYPKQKRFHHGLTVGVGLNYGVVHRTVDFGPSFIYGFTYSF